MSPFRRTITLVLVLLIFPAGHLPGQNGADARPKLGLVLSGGGAKGFAHIGVLRVLEEAGIRPDYITGTSMGSIIGALYAIGYSPDSLARLVNHLNWDQVLSDNIPLNEVIFEEKPFFNNQLLELPFEEGRIKTPSGLIRGQQIEQLLSRLTLPVYQTDDFDQLPIPFRCVASDIISGKPVVLKEGSLPDALRASMAIPTVFTPVELDSQLLVDGGLLRNFPVPEVRDMGADIIIGVYTGAQPSDPEKMNNLPGILTQVVFLTSIRDAEEQLPYVDIYIEPPLENFGAQDFRLADTIMQLGEMAAKKSLARLKALADSLDQLGPAPLAPLPPDFRSVRIDRIEVVGHEEVRAVETIGRSGLEVGRKVGAKDLERALDALYGTNFYKKVTYALERQGEQNVIRFNCQEKAPTLLKASLTYDSYHEAGFLFNVTLRNLILPSSRLMVVGKVADNHRYRLEYLKYLDEQQRLFLNFSAQLNRDEAPSFRDGLLTQQFRMREAPVSLTLNSRIGRNTLIGGGARLDYLSYTPSVGQDPPFEQLRFTNANLQGFVRWNTLDRNVMPRRGSRFDLEFRYVENLSASVDQLNPDLEGSENDLLGFDSYPIVNFRSEHFLPVGRQNVFKLFSFATYLWGEQNNFSDFYLLGGPEKVGPRAIPFYGLEASELPVQVALGGGIGYEYFLRDNLLFGAYFNGGWFGFPEFVNNDLQDIDLFLSGLGLSAGYNSFVGPVQMTLMYPTSVGGGLDRDVRLFLSYGYRF